MPVSILFAWVWIICGLISGVGIGLFFHDQDWLGGYSSWRRRMVRLGHISFLGTGLLNLGYGLCLVVLKLTPAPRLATALFILGAVTMPAVCFLAAGAIGSGICLWSPLPVSSSQPASFSG